MLNTLHSDEPLPDDELCPNCGEFVPYLHEDTGFCYPCSGIEPTRRCSECNTILGDNHDSEKCNRCRYLYWLDQNANEIERVMAVQQIKASRAKKVVLAANRPICHSCQEPIKGGTNGKHFFCRTKVHCRKASNVYRYHRIKGQPHEYAMNKAIAASVISKLIGGI